MKRYEELDSMRGLASVSVVLSHSLTMTALFATGTIYGDLFNKFVLNSPLKIFFSAHQAVVLFFILSGFVLALPYIKGKQQSYSSYLIRRICRIYIPYIFAVLFGISMRYLFSHGGIAGLWNDEITWGVIFNHLFLIGMFSQDSFNPVIWSLVHEMRISIIFPFLMILVLRWNWKAVLGFGIGCSLIGITLHYFMQAVDPRTNFFDSLHYILMFISGALLAKHGSHFIEKYKSSSLFMQVSITLIGLVSYTYSISIGSRILKNSLLAMYLSDWITTIGGIILILVAIAGKNASKFLLKGPVLFIGKISFSVYLYHLVVFLTLASLLQGKVGSLILWIIGMVISFIIATVAYFYIEKPSIFLGKLLVKKKVETKPDIIAKA